MCSFEIWKGILLRICDLCLHKVQGAAHVLREQDGSFPQSPKVENDKVIGQNLLIRRFAQNVSQSITKDAAYCMRCLFRFFKRQTKRFSWGPWGCWFLQGCSDDGGPTGNESCAHPTAHWKRSHVQGSLRPGRDEIDYLETWREIWSFQTCPDHSRLEKSCLENLFSQLSIAGLEEARSIEAIPIKLLETSTKVFISHQQRKDV